MRTVRSHEQLLLRTGSTSFATVNVVAQVCSKRHNGTTNSRMRARLECCGSNVTSLERAASDSDSLSLKWHRINPGYYPNMNINSHISPPFGDEDSRSNIVVHPLTVISTQQTTQRPNDQESPSCSGAHRPAPCCSLAWLRGSRRARRAAGSRGQTQQGVAGEEGCS